jgi:FkbM family methyltransferase
LFAVERSLPQVSDKVRDFNVPGYPNDIALRDASADHATFWQCLVERQYALEGFVHNQRLSEAYDAMVARGETPLIIDAGGNIGLAAIWFAETFPNAQIVSIEPEARNAALLRKNVAAYDDRVRVIEGALTAASDPVVITNPRAGAAGFQTAAANALPSEGETVTVPGISVDDIAAGADAAAPFIVKIDIEGGEAAVFAGNTGWLADAHLLIMELHDWNLPWQGTSRPFFRAISTFDYDYQIKGENLFCFRDTGNGSN